MFVFISGRRSGKTWQVARWFWEDPERRTILVADAKHKREVVRALQYTMPNTIDSSRLDHFWRSSVIIVGSIERMRGFGHYRQIGIDDLDRVLGNLFGPYGAVDMVTATATLVSPPPFIPRDNTVNGEVVDDNGHEINSWRSVEGAEPQRASLQIESASYPRLGSGRNNRLDV